jgi:hypothetical protein
VDGKEYRFGVEGGAVLRNYLLPIIFALLSVLPVEAAGPLETAGRVDFVTGDVWLIDASQHIRRAVRGDRLRATDTIMTAGDGEIHLDMEDGGYLAVRTNTLLKVEDYRAHGDKDDRVFLKLLKGSLRSFTGWIAKIAPNGYRTRTMTATIGVRGTDHEPLFIPEGSEMGESGTYDKVNEGATFIDHASGRIDVLPNTAGYAPLKSGAKARLLERVPDFFRPSANENLLAGRHKLVQDRLQERLDARRLDQLRSQEGAPKSEAPSEMQETPTDPNGTPGLQDAPVSSTMPGLPVAPASALVPGAAAAPASAAVPGAAAAPASAAVPGAAAAPASAVVPGAAAVPASAAVPSATAAPASAVVPGIPAAAPAVVPRNQAAPPPAVAPNLPGRPRSAAGGPRGVPEAAPSAVIPANPRNESAQPAANDREKAYIEHRKKQQEDHKNQYERDRERERERDADRQRDADREAAKRSKEQR